MVIGIGTRWSDFTTASRTAFQDKGVRFVNINVARFDAGKQAGLPVVADAREALTALTAALDGYAVEPAYRERQAALWRAWDEQVEAAYHPPAEVTGALAPGLLTQAEVLGVVNEQTDPRDVVLCAAGSMPGDLHKLWRVRDRKGYHVEYGYSCMGYEVPASIGIRLADPTRDVFAMVGDGGYLMMPTELVTAVQERVKVVVVLVQNHGFHSIGSLSESLGSQRFGTRYRYRDAASGRLEGRPAAGRPRGQRPQPRRPRHRGALARRARAGGQGGQGGPGRRRPGRHPRRDRPDRPRARQRQLVGRAGQRGVRAGRRRRRPTRHTSSQGATSAPWWRVDPGRLTD